MRRSDGFVSVNDHLVVAPDAFTSRLPAKHRERGPRVQRCAADSRSGVLADFLSEQGLGDALSGATRDAFADAWVFDGHVFPTASSSLVDDVDRMGPDTLRPFTYCDVPRRFFDPVARLDAYIGFWEDCIRRQDMPFCIGALLASEIPSLPEIVVQQVRGHFADLAGWLRAVIDDGVAKGVLRAEHGSAVAADSLIASVHGAMLAARVAGSDPSVFSVIARRAMNQLLTTRTI